MTRILTETAEVRRKQNGGLKSAERKELSTQNSISHFEKKSFKGEVKIKTVLDQKKPRDSALPIDLKS